MHTYDVMSVIQDNSNQTLLYLVIRLSYQIDMLEIEGVKLNLINVNQGFENDLIPKLENLLNTRVLIYVRA